MTVATPQSGVPWTGPGEDEMTEEIAERNEAAEAEVDLGPELAVVNGRLDDLEEFEQAAPSMFQAYNAYGIPATVAVPGLGSGIAVANFATGANRGIMARIQGKGTISKIGVHFTNATGNVRLKALRGPVGRFAPTSILADSGTVAIPGTGYQEIALGATIDVTAPTDWFGIWVDNTTAAILAAGGDSGGLSATSAIALGVLDVEAAFPGANPPVTVGGRIFQTPVLIGIA